MKMYKVLIEDVETGKKAFFFTNHLDEMTSSDFFTSEMTDAKSLDKYTMRGIIESQLGIILTKTSQ